MKIAIQFLEAVELMSQKSTKSYASPYTFKSSDTEGREILVYKRKIASQTADYLFFPIFTHHHSKSYDGQC